MARTVTHRGTIKQQAPLTPARYPQQLNLEAGLDHKDRGQAKVADSDDAQAWLGTVRRRLAQLARERDGGRVTVDDAHAHFETPPGVHSSIWGAIFHGGGYQWRRVGYQQSAWEPSHGAIISVWELVKAPVP